MSCWVYVECVVQSTKKINMKEIFGQELVLPDSPRWSPLEDISREEKDRMLQEYIDSVDKAWAEYEDNPKAFLPVGSEGSLHYLPWRKCGRRYEKWEYRISGSLRDRSDTESIVRWFANRFLGYLNSHQDDEDLQYDIYGRVQVDFVGRLSWEYGKKV